jgi:hypothetical protein
MAQVLEVPMQADSSGSGESREPRAIPSVYVDFLAFQAKLSHELVGDHIEAALEAGRDVPGVQATLVLGTTVR